MPTIAFMSSKGGAGKTTAALTLALGLARRGENVSVIDADTNQPIMRWRTHAAGLENLTVFPARTSAQLLQALDDARAQGAWLIVDTEGTARSWDQVGAIKPDLTIIPVGASPLEAAEAIRTSRSLQNMATFFDRRLPHACVFTRLPAAIRARSFGLVVRQLRAERIAIIETPLIEKEAFRAMFWNGGTLDSLDPEQVSGLESARNNAELYAGDVLRLFAPGGPLHQAPPAPAVAPAQGWAPQAAPAAAMMPNAA
ncbi:AAA family ATPase [Phenylobacterium montanum]|uniref:AAA family ATPase n=1 Tax=Phenylobacterium montanum TaxID=2823693 RepID=A0A975FXU4_9CAUL|nr:AAA family ATPase [Caulobacter sp. S6]QUD87463.1 AAA family ATPase [Caulobacter sp. S6]